MEKLVIFDFDGTLVDSEIIAARVFPEVWASMGLEMTEEYFICNFVGTGVDAEIVKELLAKLPAHAMREADRRFHQELETSLKAVHGIETLLDNKWFPACVASNSSKSYLVEALARTKMTKHFGASVFSARDLAKPKPSPDVFLHAARELGYAPEDCLVVEDSVAGIQGAQNAGMFVVGFMAGLHFHPTVVKKLIAANANAYCKNTEELQALLIQRVSAKPH